VLNRIFGPKTEEVTEGWRKLYNKKLHNYYSSSNIIRVVKSMRVGWVEPAAHMHT